MRHNYLTAIKQHSIVSQIRYFQHRIVLGKSNTVFREFTIFDFFCRFNSHKIQKFIYFNINCTILIYKCFRFHNKASINHKKSYAACYIFFIIFFIFSCKIIVMVYGIKVQKFCTAYTYISIIRMPGVFFLRHYLHLRYG